MAIDSGTVKSTLIADDTLTKVIEGLVTSIKKLETEFEQLAKKTKRDSDTLAKSYQRVSADLDPVVKRTQKYEHAAEVLSRQLKEGKISQEKYNQQLDLAKQKYSNSAAATVQYSKDLKKLGDGLATAGRELTTFVTIPIIGILGGSIKSFGDFDDAMTSSLAIMGNLDDAMRNRLAESAREVAKVTSFSAKEAAESYFFLASAGLDAAQSIEALPRVSAFAQAGNFDMARATDLLTDAQSALGLTIRDDVVQNMQNMIRVSDVLVKANILSNASVEQFSESLTSKAGTAMRQLNIDIESGVAVLAAWADQGVKAELAGERFSIVTRDLQTAFLNNTKEFNKLNISVYDSQGQFRSLADIIEDIENAFDGMSQKGQRATLMQLGFTDRSVAATQSLVGLSDLIRKYEEGLRDAGGVTQDVAERQLQSLWKQLGLVKDRLTDAGIEFGQKLAPLLIKFSDNVLIPLIEGFSSLVDTISGLPGPIQAAYGAFAIGAASLGPVLFVSGQLIQSWATLVKEAPKVASAIRVAFAPTLVVAGITTMLFWINNLITKWGEAEAAAIQYELRAAQASGKAQEATLGLIRALKSNQDGKVSESLFSASLADAENLKKVIEETQNNINKYYRDTAKVGLDPRLRTAGPVASKPKELIEQENNLRTLIGVYGDLRTTLAGVRSDGKKIKEENPFTPDFVDPKIAQRLDDVRAKLLQSISTNTKLVDVYGGFVRDERTETERRADAIQKTHTLHLAYLDDVSTYGKKVAGDLAILREREYDIADAAEKAKGSFTSLQGVLKTLGDTAFESLDKKLKEPLKAGIEAMKEGARRMIDLQKSIGSIDAELSFQLDLTAISEPRLRELESQYIDFLSSLPYETISAAEDALQRALEAVGSTVEEFKARLSEINDQAGIRQLQESGKTRAQRYKEEIEEIKRLEKAGLANTKSTAEQRLLITKGAENEISARTEAFWTEQVSGWASALGFLGDSFGGFFAQLSQYAGQLQQGYSAFSGLGPGAGWFGVFVAVVDIAHGLLEAHKQNKYNRGYMLGASALGGRDQFGEWQISAAQDTRLNIIKQSRDASNAINSAMEEIAEAIGGVLKAFESIQINIRRDGKYFEAIVGQELIGIYSSFEEAMDAALQASLLAADTIITGLSELVQEGLVGLQSGQIGRTSDLNQIVDFLSALKEISELNLPQGAIQMQELTRHFDELWRQLQRMNQITPAVAQGFTNLLQAEISAWEDWSRSIRGVQQTPRELFEERKREAELFNSQKKLRIAELQLKILELKADAERLRARARVTQAGIGLNQVEVDAWRNHIQAKATLVKAEVDITQQYIDFINAVIEAVNEVIAALEAIPDINVDDIKVPRVGGAGGRGEVRDFIADRRYEISTRGMTEYQRALADLDRTYAPMIEKAGKDKKLREELLALKEQEIQALQREHALSTVGRFREFLGLVTPFEQVRKTAEGLIKEIEGSVFGDARKAAMIGRVMDSLERQLNQLSRQEAISLFGEMISRMESLGATDQQLFEARRQAAILEHISALDTYKVRLATLRAEGRLSKEIIDAFETGITWLENQTDRVLRGNIEDDGKGRKFKENYDNLVNAQNRFGEALKKSTDLLNKYKENGLDPLTKDLIQITKDFKEIRSALGDTPDVMITYAGAVKRAIENFISPFRDIRRDLTFGDESPVDISTQWIMIQSDLSKAVERYRSGDLNAAEDLQRLIPEFNRIGRLYTPIGSQGYLTDVYSPVEDLLDEIINLTVDDLGSINNPMTVGGIEDLTVLTEQQLDILSRIESSNNRVANGIDALNRNANYSYYQQVA